ncbi:antibacterial peptide PMAP-23-like [Sagmatias obliquidens]|uniref:antibacterial peptide PMAP-23-like n=1 Tax=Sagmatias obliquidens TaxID=3371155 RepID=UPI000F44196F|nr:antibacterial peptide PMAP-23-like [Lagenorhynchus obliquidens]
MLLSNPAYDTPHGPQERPRCCQGDGETISSPSTGGLPLPLPSNPVRQQQGLRQVQLTAGEEIRDGAGQEDAWLGHCIRPRRGIKEGPACWEEADLGTMETQRASLALGRWSLWLLLLGLVVPSASAQTLSYREAVLHAVDRLNERSSEANLYRLLELDPPPKADQDLNTPKPVSFTVKETVCLRTTQQPLEQCDFKENGLVKQCVGTVTLDQSKDQFDINCNEVSGPFCVMELIMGWVVEHPLDQLPVAPSRAEKGPSTWPLPHLSPRPPGLALPSLRAVVL